MSTNTAPVISGDELLMLREARVLLSRLALRMTPPPADSGDEWDRGVLYFAAETAEHAIFQVLNIAKHHLDVPVDEGMLHGVPQEARRRENDGRQA